MRHVIIHLFLVITDEFGAYLVDLAIWEGDLGDLARFLVNPARLVAPLLLVAPVQKLHCESSSDLSHQPN